MSAPTLTDDTARFVGYWRDSLADAAIGRGAFDSLDALGDSHAVARQAFDTGWIAPAEHPALFADFDTDNTFVDVIYRPLAYRVRQRHGRQPVSNVPPLFTPLCITARLRRDGRLFPIDTVVPRDLLEPAASDFAIARVDDIDRQLTRRPVPSLVYRTNQTADAAEPGATWDDFLAACRALYRATGLAAGDASSGVADGYELLDHGYLSVGGETAAFDRAPLALYDHMLEERPALPLLTHIAAEPIAPAGRLADARGGFSRRLAYGGDRYPLTDAQRDGLDALLTEDDASVLAINGPPGTGKTTLLLSVIATLWARAAIDQTEPPVIAAASMTNQAVTNIIDACGQGFAEGNDALAGRWLPGLASYGIYHASQTRLKDSTIGQRYITRPYFEQYLEHETYIDDVARPAYLEAAARAFPELAGSDVETVVAGLHDRLCRTRDELVRLERRGTALADAQARCAAELGDDPAAVLATRRQAAAAAIEARDDFNQRHDVWQRWRANEPWTFTLFGWLPAVRARRERSARMVVNEQWPNDDALADMTTPAAIDDELARRRRRHAGQARETEAAVIDGETVLSALRDAGARWHTAIAGLDGVTGEPQDWTLADIDRLADTTLRFHMFRLATHYWEGRWLMAMSSLGQPLDKYRRSAGPAARRRQWRYRAMLTPCAVATFQTLPSCLKARRYSDDSEPPVFEDDYLYNFVDLLIVDEAGQVSPETAAGAFALARRALVIGDRQQLEPIDSIPPYVDIGNLRHAGVIEASADNDTSTRYRALVDTGRTASGGNLMRMAQQACRYQPEDRLDRGLWLYDHYRCLDDIIEYCNRLCYQGRLLPRRGNTQPDGLDMPTMGYAHVDGRSETNAQHSRYNTAEAETIAAWLAARRAHLEGVYGNGQALESLVAVVTPFAGQKQAVAAACRAEGIVVDGRDAITIGTVHALQGAERPIVLFSAVYSKHADGGFIDRRSSLLNVAVSRAKDAFIVFGDMDVFANLAPNSPRGLLGQRLMDGAGRDIGFDYVPEPRADLKAAATAGLTTLRDAAAHDRYLHRALGQAAHRVQIVTPWLVLERVQSSGALDAMAEAAARGVDVIVQVDPYWVLASSRGTTREGYRDGFREAHATLAARGIELVFVRRVHSKVLIVDRETFCIGSFNWFSAQRDTAKANHETSLAYEGNGLDDEIDTMIASLEARRIDTETVLAPVPQNT